MSGVLQTKMQLFNKRNDVEYYELSVYDKDWKSLPFASESKIIQINYLQTKSVNVYIKQEDLGKVTYICTESKHKREGDKSTVISSQICSKVK